MKPEVVREPRPFSLTNGGPFYRFMLRTGIRTPVKTARVWPFAFLVWLPLMVGQAVASLAGAPVDPTLLDLSKHTRILFALPLMLAAERLLERTARSSMSSFQKGGFGDRTETERVMVRGERLRDSWVAEAVLLTIAVIGGQLVLWRVLGSSGAFSAVEEPSAWSFPHVWYAAVALPLVQFVMFRWLWRWVIWSLTLWGLARQRLSPLATHADRAGGLGALARPITAFSGFSMAISAILASAWGTRVFVGDVAVQTLIPGIVAFLVISTTMAVLPYLVFCTQLFRARRKGLTLYGDFMRQYTIRFHEKWITSGAERHQELGTPDIQSLNDLGGAYDVVQQTRLFVFGPRMVFNVWVAGVVPMLPLLSSTLTAQAVLKRILSTVLGGFPI